MKLEQKVPSSHGNILKILDLEQDYPYFADISTSRRKFAETYRKLAMVIVNCFQLL